MAGSPGAGKTEFVKELKELDTQGKLTPKESFVVIDPDAIRDHLPGYTGSNSHLFQNAISIGVSVLYRNLLKSGHNAIIDGTLANYEYAKANVQRAIEAGSMVVILYVFQHPTVAWDFTQKREALEGRRITKDNFVDKFIASKVSIDKLKHEFKDKIVLDIVIKDYKDSRYNKEIAKVFINVDEIEKYTKFKYNKKEIERLIT